MTRSTGGGPSSHLYPHVLEAPEASKRLCPFIRMENGSAEVPRYDHTNCLTHSCMAWRPSNPVQYEPDSAQKDYGYCGAMAVNAGRHHP